MFWTHKKSWLQRYKQYLRHNPENYWFKAKLFGFGWVPVRWQGWLVVLLFLLYILSLEVQFPQNAPPSSSLPFCFFVRIVVAVVLLIAICYWKGERPQWRWGFPKK